MMLEGQHGPTGGGRDEIGSVGDVGGRGLVYRQAALLVATVHGASLEDIYSKRLDSWWSEGVFELPYPAGTVPGKWTEPADSELMGGVGGPWGGTRPSRRTPNRFSSNERPGERTAASKIFPGGGP